MATRAEGRLGSRRRARRRAGLGRARPGALGHQEATDSPISLTEFAKVPPRNCWCTMSARSLLILAALFSSSSFATPAIDPQFGSHVVIQRDKPIVLSGTAAPNERVSVSFAGATEHATTDKTGSWRASFKPHDSGGPYTITAKASSGAATSEDVMVGDVWLCSGQSNMEYPLRRALNSDGEVQTADDTGSAALQGSAANGGRSASAFCLSRHNGE